MDLVYDHIQEEELSSSTTNNASISDSSTNPTTTSPPPASSPTLKSEFTALASSPWASTLGTWFTQARKQGESFVQDLQKEAIEAQEQATKGFTSLKDQVVSRTRSLSLSASAEGGEGSVEVPGEEAVPSTKSVGHKREGSGASAAVVAEAEALKGSGSGVPESLPSDIVREAGTLVASLRTTAASKLKDLQRAEDAADEALLKFGTNVRNFLRDAVTISGPADDTTEDTKNGAQEVLFETQEPGTGKKVFHSTRLDAQLHAIHTTPSSFTEDSSKEGEEWEKWKVDFDIDAQTEAVARDLERYEELRHAMERLVPEKVEYRVFWMRYYFLRKAVEEEERRRREVLKGASTNPEEEVAWDDDDEDESSPPASASTPNPTNVVKNNTAASESTTTLNAPATDDTLLKPPSPRRSHEDESKSVADSDASYDIVSGATSRAAGSPREEKREVVGKEDSDDDWE